MRSLLAVALLVGMTGPAKAQDTTGVPRILIVVDTVGVDSIFVGAVLGGPEAGPPAEADRARYVGKDDWLGRQMYRVHHFERGVHHRVQEMKWVLPASIAGMTAGELVYVFAHYGHKSQHIHLAQTIFNVSFNVGAYALLDRRVDYVAVRWAQNVLLQVVINVTFGHPAFWAQEPRTWDLYGLDVPKFWGGRRFLQLVSAVVLAGGTRLVEYVNEHWE